MLNSKTLEQLILHQAKDCTNCDNGVVNGNQQCPVCGGQGWVEDDD